MTSTCETLFGPVTSTETMKISFERMNVINIKAFFTISKGPDKEKSMSPFACQVRTNKG